MLLPVVVCTVGCVCVALADGEGHGAWVVLSLILLVRGKDMARSGWILQVAIGSVAGVSNSFGFMTMGPSLRTEGGLK